MACSSKFENKELSLFLCTVAKLVTHLNLIGPSDYFTKFCQTVLSPCDQNPDYGFFGHLTWNKTVVEERDFLLQILFGAMDIKFRPHAQ